MIISVPQVTPKENQTQWLLQQTTLEVEPTFSGFATIMCISKKASGIFGRKHFTIGCPNVRFGTKCPSITSRCRQSDPLSRSRWHSEAKDERSALKIEGPILHEQPLVSAMVDVLWKSSERLVCEHWTVNAISDNPLVSLTGFKRQFHSKWYLGRTYRPIISVGRDVSNCRTDWAKRLPE